MSPLRLTREELHEMVWERAVSRVAPGLGISDVGLRKRCRALHVPLPDARYWGRLHAGKLVKRAELPPAPAGVPGFTTFYPGKRDRLPAVAAALEEAAGIEAAAVPARRHPLVRATLAALREARQDQNGGVKCGGPGLFAVRAHPDTIDRAGSFLDLLVATARANGFALEDTAEGTALGVCGERVAVSVTQVIRRTRHQPTPAELARRESWDRRHRGEWDWFEGRPEIPYYDFAPTGVMAVEVGGWPRPAGVTHRFADSSARRVEERVAEVLASARAHAAYRLEWRKERDAERARAEAARARLLREEAERRREEQRVQFLGTLLGRRHELGEIDALLLALAGDDAGEFLGWAAARRGRLAAALEPAAVEAEAATLGLFGGDSNPA